MMARELARLLERVLLVATPARSKALVVLATGPVELEPPPVRACLRSGLTMPVKEASQAQGRRDSRAGSLARGRRERPRLELEE